jgi:hypothetical protein
MFQPEQVKVTVFDGNTSFRPMVLVDGPSPTAPTVSGWYWLWVGPKEPTIAKWNSLHGHWWHIGGDVHRHSDGDKWAGPLVAPEKPQ